MNFDWINLALSKKPEIAKVPPHNFRYGNLVCCTDRARFHGWNNEGAAMFCPEVTELTKLAQFFDAVENSTPLFIMDETEDGNGKTTVHAFGEEPMVLDTRFYAELRIPFDGVQPSLMRNDKGRAIVFSGNGCVGALMEIIV